MSVIKELIRTEDNGMISFGNYELDQKSKLDDYEYAGDVFKVKTFREITKLEQNGLFVYESVPGTAVESYSVSETGVTFTAYGEGDAQITLGLEADTSYEVYINEELLGEMKTNLGGKLSLSVELFSEAGVGVRIIRL